MDMGVVLELDAGLYLVPTSQFPVSFSVIPSVQEPSLKLKAGAQESSRGAG